MDMTKLKNLSYKKMIIEIATSIGTDLEDSIATLRSNGDYLSDSDIVELMKEAINDIEYELRNEGIEINKTLLLGKLSGDGFEGDVMSAIKDEFYFPSDDDMWQDDFWDYETDLDHELDKINKKEI